MRYPYTLMLLLPIGTSPLCAQILENSTISPVPGDAHTVSQGPYFDPGPAGAAQTWDLSALAADLTVDITYITPEATGYAASFPGSTVAQVDPTQPGNYTFHAATSDGLLMLGARHQAADATMFYSDPERLIPYPCTYMGTWTDTFAASAVVDGFPTERNGTITGQADGFGTLIMPYGAINNVLRVHITEEFTDDVEGLYVITFQSDRYLFYKPGVHTQVAGAYHYTATVMGNTTEIDNAQWVSAETVGIQDALNNAIGIDVFPNPAQDRITLAFGSQGGALRVEVFDANGRLLLADDTSASLGIDNHTLDVSVLPAGPYHVRITDGTGQQGTRRFMKQ